MKFIFESCLLDTERRELSCGGNQVIVQPQVFDLLVHLIRNRNRVLGREELISLVWGGRVVSDSTFTSRINAARTALGDSGEAQKFIRTFPRKGFRFVGQVVERPDGVSSANALQTAQPASAKDSAGAERPAAGQLWNETGLVFATSTGTARHAASSSSDDEPSAGDASDVSSMLKSIEYERENGPLEFGRPYEAGNERTLDGQIAKALGLMGLPQRLAPGVKKIIMRESTGNADAVNDWDSNAASGTPSKGLMQLIDTTFRNAVLPELADRGIFDPVANITAGVRTMIANHSIDDVLAGGLRNSSGNYIGYGGAAIPDDGLGLAD